MDPCPNFVKWVEIDMPKLVSYFFSAGVDGIPMLAGIIISVAFFGHFCQSHPSTEKGPCYSEPATVDGFAQPAAANTTCSGGWTGINVAVGNACLECTMP